MIHMQFFFVISFIFHTTLMNSVADPDLELRGEGGGVDSLALLAFLPSVDISSFFNPKLGAPSAPLRHWNRPFTTVGHVTYFSRTQWLIIGNA